MFIIFLSSVNFHFVSHSLVLNNLEKESSIKHIRKRRKVLLSCSFSCFHNNSLPSKANNIILVCSVCCLQLFSIDMFLKLVMVKRLEPSSQKSLTRFTEKAHKTLLEKDKIQVYQHFVLFSQCFMPLLNKFLFL